MKQPHDQEAMQAIVLAGGLGTRLRLVVGDAPKVLALVRGRPFLAYLLDQLRGFGFSEAILSVGYRAEQIRSTFGDQCGGLRLIYSTEDRPLGTAGALRQAVSLIRGAATLVLNGDSYCRLSWTDYREAHRRGGQGATLALVQVPDVSRYGSVQQDAAGHIVAFREKGADTGAGWVNAGLYLVQSEWLRALPEKAPLSLERDVLPGWVEQGLFGYRCPGPFIDIGVPESYRAAQTFFSEHGHRNENG